MLKRIIIDVHISNYDEIKELKSEIRREYTLYGDDYLDTLAFATQALRLARLQVLHSITFNLIRLWR